MSSDLISEWFMLGINLFMAAWFIACFMSILSASHEVSRAMADQQAQRYALQEYKKYNQFDHTHVYAQDVISGIYEYRGLPEVTVTCGGNTFLWTKNSTPLIGGVQSKYLTSDITKIVKQTCIYDADLDYSKGNGEVSGVVFRECNGSCGR